MTLKDPAIVRTSPLGAGQATEFHFLGFAPAQVDSFRQAIEDVRLIAERPAWATLAGITISPLRPRADGKFWGNLFSADRTVCEHGAVRQKGPGLIFGLPDEPFPEDEPGETIPAAIYGGVLFAGFGHIVLESLARLGPDVAASDLPILFHIHPTRRESVPVLQSMLSFLGVDPRRVRLIDRVLKVKALHAPTPGLVLGESLSLPYVAFVRDAVRRRATPLAQSSDQSGDRPVLLSRSALTGPQRRAFGEDFIEDAVGGFAEVVHPQVLSFADQVAQVNAASRLFGFIGSQFHTLLFRTREEPLDVVYLASPAINPAFFQIDLLFGGRRVYVNATRYGQVFEFGKISPFLVNFDAVAEGLTAAGFAPRGFELAPGAVELQRFEEAYYRSWFELLVYAKLLRPSRYWDPAKRTELLVKACSRIKGGLAAVRANPDLARLAREAVADTCRKYGKAADRTTAAIVLESLLG